jgi:hypothetical protein
MPQSASIQTPGYRHIFLMFVALCFSIVIPATIIGLALHSAFGGKAFGLTSNESKIYQGGFKNGELWFTTFKRDGSLIYSPHFECHIKRLDLMTGVEHETGLKTTNSYVYPIWLGEELYAVSDTDIYHRAGSSLELLAKLPARSAGFHPMPFLDQGRLTTIVEMADYGYRLVHLIEGSWVDGRKIRLPGLGRVWYDNPERNVPTLLPLSSDASISTTQRQIILGVINDGQDFHILQTDFGNFAAYRRGFEFDDEYADIASAEAPENAPHEVSGWKPISSSKTERRWIWMDCDRHGMLFAGSGDDHGFVKRFRNEAWEELIGSENLAIPRNAILVASPTEDNSFLISEDQVWSSAEIYRIEGNTVQPAHIQLPGFVPKYLARWQKLAMGIVAAWLLHHLILMSNSIWLSRSLSNCDLPLGFQCASCFQRALATTIDLMLAMTIVVTLTYFYSGKRAFGITDSPDAAKELGNWLFSYETAIHDMVQKRMMLTNVYWLSPQFVEPLRKLVRVGLGVATLLWFIKLAVESRNGFTPGKWLLGIQTVRSNLRPIGLARAVVRDVMFFVDVPLLLTSIPAEISILLSNTSQRLGDRVADTIVIRAKSIRRDNNRGSGPSGPAVRSASVGGLP